MCLEDFAGRRVTVIGGFGFLGRPLVRRLVDLGAEVSVVSRQGRVAGNTKPAAVYEGDAAEPGYLSKVFQDFRPHTVFNMATAGLNTRDLSLVPKTFVSDLTTVVEGLTATVETGVERFVLMASLEEPEAAVHPVPQSPYAAAKFAMRAYGRMFHEVFGAPVVTLRPFMGYGPGQSEKKLIPYLIKCALNNEAPQMTSGVKRTDWVYVDDLIEGFLRGALLPSPPPEPIDLATGKLHSVREVAKLVSELIPDAPEPLFGELPDRNGDDIVRHADMTAARELLDWEARVSLREGLHLTIEKARQALMRA